MVQKYGFPANSSGLPEQNDADSKKNPYFCKIKT